jgi:hypothetical protein
MEVFPWLTSDYVLSVFSQDTDQARKVYESFVNDGVDEGKRNEFICGTLEGRILGDDAFADDVLGRVNQKREREYSLNDVVSEVSACFHIPEEKLKAAGKIRPMAAARAVVAAIVQLSPHLRLTELSKLLGRDVSALGKAANRVADEKDTSELVEKMIEKLRKYRLDDKCPKL